MIKFILYQTIVYSAGIAVYLLINRRELKRAEREVERSKYQESCQEESW